MGWSTLIAAATLVGVLIIRGSPLNDNTTSADSGNESTLYSNESMASSTEKFKISKLWQNVTTTATISNGRLTETPWPQNSTHSESTTTIKILNQSTPGQTLQQTENSSTIELNSETSTYGSFNQTKVTSKDIAS